MIKGIGNDIIAIERIQSSIDHHGQHFLDRVFTPAEQAYCLKYKDSARHFAGRFSAKEAVVKALGKGFREGIGWQDIEILNDPLGKPYLRLSPKIDSLFLQPRILISISHCHSYATAFAIWEA